jgi:hypothetical protein
VLYSQTALRSKIQHRLHYFINIHLRAVYDYGIGRWTQRRYSTIHVTVITGTDVLEKGRQANTLPFIYQLVIAPTSPFLSAGGEVYLEWRIKENYRPHIPAIRYQTRCYCKISLALQ